MIELRRLNLEEKKDMDLFNAMSEEYYTDVCTPDELSQEIADLYDDELNAELIEQTKRKKDPYYIMGIENNKKCIGFISYIIYQSNQQCFINNFYITSLYRNQGFGAIAYAKAEEHIRNQGSLTISLLPEKRAVPFYQRFGFTESGKTKNGETIFRKLL